ncbi:glycan metabolism protein RagB [Emticicia aquatilis]|uniref:Glycan metabolism protein RagB n=1 Tax=Emticicia aquatilis TaxID=1537369 RepID=A0A917DKW5_9BACT|nr:RagB/SusD family nutrient uptake outer membrane protein [Emticicia aquatilis]GGD45775.1 glycan metabolism protein RagB [Emticicia aquatilis]
MKKISFKIALIFLVSSLWSCEKYLDQQPIGEQSLEQLKTKDGVESLLTGAYHILNGQFDSGEAYNSAGSNWSFGDVRSGDAYKGSSGTTDQVNIHDMEVFSSLNSTNLDAQRKWACLYEGIRRCNNILQIINDATGFTESLRQQRIAETRFLRGHYYFELKKIFNKPAYIDETAKEKDDFYVANDLLSDEQFWKKIEDDFKAAVDGLPTVKSSVGRPSRYAAWAYLCKAYMFQKKWNLASTAADSVIQKGGYSLLPNYSDVFTPEFENGAEMVFAIQHSINDGASSNKNGSVGDRLNRIATPAGSGYPVAAQGFHRPSQNLVNFFKTTAAGLPAYSDVNVTTTDNLDPRLDFSVARVGIPFLDYTKETYKANWTRGNAVYGDFSPKKKMVSPISTHYDRNNQGITDLNYYLIRYADVLLWKAEALIELKDIDTGIGFINQIRNRAKNSRKVQKLAPATGDAATYKIEPYPVPFVGGYTEAIKALKAERRLELNNEGHRFFDLVRWGDAATVINAYFATEKAKRSYLNTAAFTPNKHEYLPIPQVEIDLSKGNLKQNQGY